MDHRRKRPYPRSRRAQYVNEACTTCKRRKTRCDGSKPCGRCVTQSATCVYLGDAHRPPEKSSAAETSEIDLPPADGNFGAGSHTKGAPKSVHNAFKHQSCAAGDPTPLDGPVYETREFCGPSSSEFTLNVVSGNLKAMGMPTAILGKSTADRAPPSSLLSPLAPCGPFRGLLNADPVWGIRREDAFYLIQQWCQGVGSLYPVVDYNKMMEMAAHVFDALERAQENENAQKGFLMDALFNNETYKLKIVLAIGKTLEGAESTDQARKLFQSTAEVVEGLLWNPNGIDGIQLLVLTALFHYHLDDEVRTGRIIGLASRLCLEMGLHRRSMVDNAFPNAKERKTALQTFQSVYMLERRTSLGQGIPYLIQDSHVDPSIFSMNGSNPMISALLGWTKLAGKVWKALNSQGESRAEVETSSIDCLDDEIIRWYEQLPNYLKLNSGQFEYDQEPRVRHMQAILFFRKSHLRNLNYRPVLESFPRIRKHESYARIAVQIASETLRVLAELHENTDFVRLHATFFKHPLLTAFGNLLLAIVYAGSAMWDSVRDLFDTALELINFLSTRSKPLMRLWKRLQGLRQLRSRFPEQQDQHSIEHESTPGMGDLSSGITFDELFSSFSPPASYWDGTEQLGQGSDDFILRDHIQSLLEASAGSNGFFDFPFME